MISRRSIYCQGALSCGFSTGAVLYDATNVFCSGGYSCNYNTDIVNVTNVYIMGYNADFSTGLFIISNGISETKYENMTVHLMIYDSSIITIECHLGDICFVNCLVEGSCNADGNSPDIMCDGTCYICCGGPYNISCPASIDENDFIQIETCYDDIFGFETMTTTLATKINPTTTTTPENTNTKVITTYALPTGKDKNSEDNYSQYIEGYEIGGYICLFGSLLLPVVIFGWSYVYHSQRKFIGCDKPNYFAIFAAFWTFGDFYSDIMFCMVLLLLNNYLLYFSLCFSIIPHIIGNILALVHIHKWSNYNIYISKYINRYDWLLITVSAIAGFYSSIELARSKIFYISKFSMQLKREDYEKIQNFRLLNTVILELSRSLILICMRNCDCTEHKIKWIVT